MVKLYIILQKSMFWHIPIFFTFWNKKNTTELGRREKVWLFCYVIKSLWFNHYVVSESLGHHRIPRWLSGKEFSCQCRRPRFDPRLGRCPGEGNGNPLQYSCQENPMDRGAWHTTIHGAAKEVDVTEWLSHKLRRKLACIHGWRERIVGSIGSTLASYFLPVGDGNCYR